MLLLCLLLPKCMLSIQNLVMPTAVKLCSISLTSLAVIGVLLTLINLFSPSYYYASARLPLNVYLIMVSWVCAPLNLQYFHFHNAPWCVTKRESIWEVCFPCELIYNVIYFFLFLIVLAFNVLALSLSYAYALCFISVL